MKAWSYNETRRVFKPLWSRRVRLDHIQDRMADFRDRGGMGDEGPSIWRRIPLRSMKHLTRGRIGSL